MKSPQLINAERLKNIFQAIANAMTRAKDRLCEADAVCGDGDLGVTLSTGFTAVAQEVLSLNEADIGKILLHAAQTLGRVSPSTLGTLLATGLLYAGKAAMGKTVLTAQDCIELFKAARRGIMARGKAQQGDKTILDALIPAEEAWEEVAMSGGSLAECAKASLEAAKRGAEATRVMVPKIGRASWLKEKSIGHADAGALALVVILEAFVEFLNNAENSVIGQ